jgi:hypothetical protein
MSPEPRGFQKCIPRIYLRRRIIRVLSRNLIDALATRASAAPPLAVHARHTALHAAPGSSPEPRRAPADLGRSRGGAGTDRARRVRNAPGREKRAGRRQGNLGPNSIRSRVPGMRRNWALFVVVEGVDHDAVSVHLANAEANSRRGLDQQTAPFAVRPDVQDISWHGETLERG